MPPIWEHLSADEHEAFYNPQRSVPDFAAYQARRQPHNTAAAKLPRHTDVAYGPHALHKLDIYPAPDHPHAPVHVFFHGGYWRAQDKQNFAFVATQLTAHGITAVIANYALCPAVTLDGTVESAILCVAWIAREIHRYGGDGSKLTMSGHSAGAHLGAACLATDWAARGFDHRMINAAVLISGLYDPAPAARTSVNAEIRLTAELIERHDYERHRVRVHCPVWIIAGAREPWHWIDNSYRYAHHLHRQGLAPGVIVSPEVHHFDIMNQYLDPASDVMRCILALAR